LGLESLLNYYRFEFFNDGDARVITKEQLFETIALVTAQSNSLQSSVFGGRS